MILCSCNQPASQPTSEQQPATAATTKQASTTPAAVATKPADVQKKQDVKPDQPTTTRSKAEKTAAAKESETQEAAKQLPTPKVLATVGDHKVMSTIRDKNIAAAPPGTLQAQIDQYKKQFIEQAVLEILLTNYVNDIKAQGDDEKLAKIKLDIAAAAAKSGEPVEQFMKDRDLSEEKLVNYIKITKMFDDATSDEKAKEFIKAHPEYFNGTKAAASHILVLCKPTDSTDKVKKAFEKINQIAADIKSGKTTFEEAAAKESDCPSGKRKGGDLGEFVFGNMTPPFAIAAFDMKKGEMRVARSDFGVHLIKAGEKTPGAEPEDPNAMDIARNALKAAIMDKVAESALTKYPIVSVEEADAAPAAQPKTDK